MLRKRPESFDAVDMRVILPAISPKRATVLDREMLAKAFERTVAAEGVGEIHRSFPRLLADDLHERGRIQRIDDPGIDLPIPLQEPQNHTLARRTPSALALAPSAKVRLVDLDLPREPRPFQFADVVQDGPESAVHSIHGVPGEAEVGGMTEGWNLLVEADHDLQLSSQFLQPLQTSALPALHVSAFRLPQTI